MINSTPVERVAALLENADFKRIEVPLRLADISFDIPGAFVGTGKSSDLILILDTAFDSEQRILQKITGIARVLDAMASKRPLTAVLTGPRPSIAIIDGISRVCRVLFVNPTTTATAEKILSEVRDSLAVLMPLELPPFREGKEEAIATFLTNDPISQQLVDASLEGAQNVEKILGQILNDPLIQIESDKHAKIKVNLNF